MKRLRTLYACEASLDNYINQFRMHESSFARYLTDSIFTGMLNPSVIITSWFNGCLSVMLILVLVLVLKDTLRTIFEVLVLVLESQVFVLILVFVA